MSALDRAAGAMNWMFPTLPWAVRVSYAGQSRVIGQGPEKVEMACRTEAALRSLIACDLSRFLDYYVAGEADLNGDMYAFVGARNHVRRDELWRIKWRYQLRYLSTALFPSSVRRKLTAVSSHYDLPNEFILSYLDTRTRAYSCAMWKSPEALGDLSDQALEDAQHDKFAMALDELQIQPDDKFLDIGCGYGYAVHLAESKYGCRNALGITLSQNQIDEGYSKNLKLKHYMEVPADGTFDKIYTCGMISHLDRAEIEQYYRHVFGLLKSGGKVWFHAIIPPANDAGLTNYTTISGTFSQKYVFPDHFQFPLHVHLKMIERLGFRVKKVHFRYGHYAKTLRHWYKRFVENLPRTRPMITPTIERAWHLYLTYASVVDGPNSVLKQIVCEKP
ncbi:MAG: methyltransferase domain-containing protein [Elusimicrobia bacterium]|nr:methyltransferase domain-containing protein [Elusimicrobiota bacterium]